jgi:D-alanyl-lipoteichoic acid acyltransferase DltB (MBOAT superfamily)
MTFTSLPFIFFITIFFLLYWVVFNKSLKIQNLLLLIGSYFFYAYWDWHFLFLLVGSSLFNYFLAIWMAKSKKESYRNLLVWIGLLQGVGCLIYFKYFNFFIKTLISGFAAFNISLDIHTLNILLPLGISFYTFRTISYLLDIKKRKIEPTTDLIVFFSYVSFFPCVLAGPIDRPKALIPQLETKREFNYLQASDGMRQILWGIFKKVVIADNCANFTSHVFDNYSTMPASALLFCTFLYTIQIYADFSGYSDIAIGVSSILGFKVTRNFNFPFFAQNIADFWRRWNISLTSWLTDYVFTPLSIYFRDYGKMGLVLAILINFTVIGIWHGANWTFILFGFLHGCYFIPLILKGTMNKKTALMKNQPISFSILINMLGTFILVAFTFVIFRADSLVQAFEYLHRIFSKSLFSVIPISEKVNMAAAILSIFIMFFVEWLQRDKQHALQIDFLKSFALRALIYFFIIGMILSFSPSKGADFIYFKF